MENGEGKKIGAGERGAKSRDERRRVGDRETTRERKRGEKLYGESEERSWVLSRLSED